MVSMDIYFADTGKTATLTRILAIFNQGKKPKARIVYIWGLNGPDRLPDPSKKVEGDALHPFGRVWRSIGPV